MTALSAVLSLNVVKQRLDLNTWQGEKTHGKEDPSATGIQQPDGHCYDPLLIATRVHANLLENLPLTLLLAAAVELNGGSRRNLSRVLLAFTALRVSHVVGLTRAIVPFRAAGMRQPPLRIQYTELLTISQATLAPPVFSWVLLAGWLLL